MIDIINNLNLIRFLEQEKLGIKTKLFSLLFEEINNLNSIEFSISSEYNDNNYFNNIELKSVNKIPLEPYTDSYFVDEKGIVLDGDPNEDYAKPADKSLIISSEYLSLIYQVVQEVGSVYDYGDHVLERKDFLKTKPKKSVFYADYLGREINVDDFEDDFNALKQAFIKKDVKFKGVDPRLALIYSTIKKLDKNQEECFKENIEYAYYYAKYVLKEKLSKEIENLFRMKAFEKDALTPREKYYLGLYNDFAKQE